MSGRERIGAAERWVVKIGSSLLTADGQGLDEAAISGWVAQMATLRQKGIEVVLVSSGSVAAGMHVLGWGRRPSELHELQVAAAVGQMDLVQTYDRLFGGHELKAAQVLLTHPCLSDRQRYLNARSALRTMLQLGVVPVVNENDTVVTDEIKFGDNDSLGALVANLVEADVLVLLTDQDGLFDADPRSNPEAKMISEARAGDPDLWAVAGDGGALGRGGMITKLRAAKTAARSGAHTVIVGGRIERVLERLQAGEALGTLLTPEREPVAARKQWLAGHLQVKGQLVLDAGAVNVLRNSGSSLLPVGVRKVKGEFRRGELVACVDEQGRTVAHGLVNYPSTDARKIIGLPSHQIEGLLGYIEEPELVHRDNLALI